MPIEPAFWRLRYPAALGGSKPYGRAGRRLGDSSCLFEGYGDGIAWVPHSVSAI